MARQNLRNLLFFTLLLIAHESPRVHVEARTLLKREVEVEATTMNESFNELTTSGETDEKVHGNSSTIAASVTEATTVPTVSTSSESLSFTSSESINRLYDELLKSTPTSSFSIPTTFSYFETSEFMKFENSNIDESKSDESSLEKKFKEDEQSFRNNSTKEERHSINEASFDEEVMKYSKLNTSKTQNGTDENESVKTTALPAIVTTAKKGKYLDLIPRGDDNINASIPNAAEVWALAGMREMSESRNPVEEDSTSSGVELMNDSLNNTAKNLLDWSEIAKMSNESITEEDSSVGQTTVYNDISGVEDPATSENKEVKVVMSSLGPSTNLPTVKSVAEDNRLEIESGNSEFGSTNKSQTATSRIDSNVFEKSQEDREESAVELIDPTKKLDTSKTKESLSFEEVKNDLPATTESTTDAAVETTTMENFETTTSIVDTFTVIGEDEETDDVFKRTITEMPPATTTDLPVQEVTQMTQTTTTTIVETTTEIPSPTVNEIPESTQKYNKTTSTPTKSISTRVVTTDSPRVMKADTTDTDNGALPSTLIPKFFSTATTQQFDESFDISSSSSTIEIVDDDKFKYSTVQPETTSAVYVGGKSGELEESTTKGSESLNKESLDEGSEGGSSLGIISAIVSAVVILVLVGVVYYVLKRRNKQNFSQRCRPVGLDAYSLDNVSVYNSVRRKANTLRLSKRSYGNSAFEDPSLQSNVLDYQSLQDFAKNKMSIQDEFKEIPQVSVRVDEAPDNCEDKNRYANVVPLPETRVHLQRLNDEEKSEYINANYVKGPKDTSNYYIATQAPLENTCGDFWRMIWEQNSKVIIQATDLTENGVERCAEYLPASVVLDNSLTYGDFQVTLKSREVKGKYAVSQVHLKNLKSNTWREIMHLWYSWPENGCPTDESSIISLLLEARGYLRTTLPEQLDENSNMEDKDKLSTLDKTKSLQRVQGPLTIHCSPGTGRTGTLIACDIILRYLEIPPRQIDIPQIVYAVRRGRASSVRTKDQYEFIYQIANAYAIKLNTAPTES